MNRKVTLEQVLEAEKYVREQGLSKEDAARIVGMEGGMFRYWHATVKNMSEEQIKEYFVKNTKRVFTVLTDKQKEEKRQKILEYKREWARKNAHKKKNKKPDPELEKKMGAELVDSLRKIFGNK